MNKKQVERHWLKIATKQFVGRMIVSVRFLTPQEQQDLGWDSRSIVLVLNDGTLIYPSRDEEGNDAGTLFTTNAEDNTFPSIF